MDVLPHRPPPARSRGQWAHEQSVRLRDWVVWFGIWRLLGVAASVAAVGAGGFWLLRAPPTPVDASLPRAGAVSGSTTTLAAAVSGTSSVTAVAVGASTSTPATAVVVHVAGAVMVPGVRTLPAGARVADAVEAAGGAAPDAVLDAINLAQPLADGDRVYVPRAGDAPAVPPGVSGAVAASSLPGSPSGPVDLNTATVDQLDALPGVGPATAQAIVSHRDQHGPFASVDALADVRGIGPAKLETLRPLVMV